MIKTPSRILYWCFPGVIWHKNRQEKIVYITFDDGPNPNTTPWILETLMKYNVKATFFCLGRNAEQYPDLIRRINNEGHELANHGYHHLDGWKTPVNEYVKNVIKASVFIPNNIFRPPYGRLKLTSLIRLKKNYRIVMWDLLVEDYKEDILLEKTIEKIKKKTRNGSILIFHDNHKASNNLRSVLPKILDYFSKLGLLFGTL